MMPDLNFELDRAYALVTTDHGDEDASDRLYRLWYHEQRGVAMRFPSGSAYHTMMLDLDRFEAGWTISERVVRGDAPDAWRVSRGDQERVVAFPDIAPTCFDADVNLDVGAPALVSPFTSATSGGFWHLHSPLWQQEGPADPRKRVYFSVARDKELDFVQRFAASAPLDTNWAFKILSGVLPSGRRDAAVFYLPADIPLGTGWFPNLLDGLQDLLSGPCPPGTSKIRPGVASAPEISTTKSFGQLMCDALVEVSADHHRLLDQKQWMAAAHTRLHELMTCGGQPS